MPQKKLTGREKQAVAIFCALHSTLHKQDAVLEQRLKDEGKYAWRDWRLMMKLADKISDVIVSSMVDKDCLWLDRLLREAKVGIDMNGPLQKPGYAVVDAKDLAWICKLAARQECTLCLRTGKEVKACPLRASLIYAAPPPDGESPLGLCEYAEVNWDEVH